MKIKYLLFALLTNFAAQSHIVTPTETVPVFADLHLLKTLKVPVLVQEPQINLGYAYLTPTAQMQMSLLAHQYGKCGGFEVVQDVSSRDIQQVIQSVKMLTQQRLKDNRFSRPPSFFPRLPVRPEIAEALAKADEKNLQTWVQWLSAFPHRYNKDANPNNHVMQLKVELEKMLSRFRVSGSVELVEHKSTKQKTLKLTLPGTSRPEEIIVLGGHLDSITFSGKLAPGADDNASGSSNLIEALRVILTQPRAARTLEFMWYAGEESGLLGSAEIAAAYKKLNKKVIGVLQLDMTLFPGDGEFVLANITDYTSAWMRSLLMDINANYLNVKFIEDACGYACSDHASWYRQGFPTLHPFEASSRKMNSSIHSPRDVVSPLMNFKHSLVFTKIAIALAMELGNNTSLRSPY